MCRIPGLSSRWLSRLGSSLLLVLAGGACSSAAAPTARSASPARLAPLAAEPVTLQPAPEVAPQSSDSSAQTAATEIPATERTANHVPAWLGIGMQEGPNGVLIETVWRGSPAAASGLKTGDLVLRIGDTSVSRPSDVISAVSTHAPGEVVGVQVLRNQQYRLLSVTLDAKPDADELLGKLFIGAPAPALDSLRTVQGSVVPSVSPGGHVRVIEFWASWCVACRALGPTLNQWQQELAVLGVDFLGVTMDAFEQAATAARQLGMEYSVFVDESGEVTRAYQGTALPTLFVVDAGGVIRAVTVGYNPAKFNQTRALIKELALAAAPVNPLPKAVSATGK